MFFFFFFDSHFVKPIFSRSLETDDTSIFVIDFSFSYESGQNWKVNIFQ